MEAARSAARSIVGTRPSPTGGYSWLDEDIDELVNETIRRVGTDKVALAANEAANDAEFVGGWVRRALWTTLDIRARRTPLGRVMRAVDDALGNDREQFRLKSGFWCLGADDREPKYRYAQAALVAAAWTVQTDTVRVSQSAVKTPPMAARRDIRAVCAAVLDLSGPLTKADLAEVVAQRFNVAFEERFDYLDLDDHRLGQQKGHSAEDEFDDEQAAQWMFEQLSFEDRDVLGLVLRNASLRDLAGALGCSKHRASIIRNRLVNKLGHMAALSPDDGQAAMEQLLEMVGQQEMLRHSTELHGGEHGD